MRAIVVLFLSIFMISGATAQQSAEEQGPDVKLMVIDGDTTISYMLDDFVYEKRDYQYHRIKRYVRNMYPYLLHSTQKLAYYDSVLATIEKDRKRNKFMKKANKELKEHFKWIVKDMSLTEGKVLVKLLHKETGMTAYEIISKYRGAANALLWQGLSKTGGADLKLTYDPESSSFDRYLKRILDEVDRGLVEVADEPDTMTKEEFKEIKRERRERKRARRKRAREERRAERKARRNGNEDNVASR